jgi:hypothetical protein
LFFNNNREDKIFADFELESNKLTFETNWICFGWLVGRTLKRDLSQNKTKANLSKKYVLAKQFFLV